MMREMNMIATSLFEKIRDRFSNVSLGDSEAKATQSPEDARFFNFNYVADKVNLGDVTISLVDAVSLKIYFSKNISSELHGTAKKEWYAFLKDLRSFARRNLLSFEPRDITRSTLSHRDMQTSASNDSVATADDVTLAETSNGVNEGKMYGSRKSSYEKDGSTRIIVRHTESVDPEKRGSRSRKIKGIFIENSEGERVKLPMNNLRYARAMARHITEGGVMHDDFGQYITTLAEECSKLRPFKSKVSRRTFDDAETQAMVESAVSYYNESVKTLSRISGKRGYAACKEDYTPSKDIITDDLDLEALKERFAKKTYDDKFNDALPLVQKAHNMKKQNKYSEDFEQWANTIAEGNWATAESDEDVADLAEILSKTLIVGVDAINATSELYNLVGDDDLFDLLSNIAKDKPDDDVSFVVRSWLKDNMPELSKKVEALQTDEPEDELTEERIHESRYYNNPSLNGYQDFYDELVPASDNAGTVEGELLRAVSRIGHDYHNNGFGNNWSGALNYLERMMDIDEEEGVLREYATGDNAYGGTANQIEAAIDSITDKVLVRVKAANGNYRQSNDDLFTLQDDDWAEEEDEDNENYYDDDEEEIMYEGAADKLKALAMAGMLAGGANTILDKQADSSPIVGAMTSAMHSAKLDGDSAMYNEIRQELRKVKLSMDRGRGPDLNFVDSMNAKYGVVMQEEAAEYDEDGSEDNPFSAQDESDMDFIQAMNDRYSPEVAESSDDAEPTNAELDDIENEEANLTDNTESVNESNRNKPMSTNFFRKYSDLITEAEDEEPTNAELDDIENDELDDKDVVKKKEVTENAHDFFRNVREKLSK